MFREVDFMYDKKDIPAVVETIEYDPNRTGFIARVCYKDGERRYVLAPKSVKVGDTFLVSEKAGVVVGNRLPLKHMPIGTFVYNIEIKPGGGAALARSAGNFAEVIALEGGVANIKLPSTEVRKISENAWASVGAVSNDENWLVTIGKAGRSRWLGGLLLNGASRSAKARNPAAPRNTPISLSFLGVRLGRAARKLVFESECSGN